MAWLNTGFAVECFVKAAIMKKEGLNRWPDRNSAPELWTHDLSALFWRLGVDPLGFSPTHRAAPALKMVLQWERKYGYSVEKISQKYANDICEAAFGSDGSNG